MTFRIITTLFLLLGGLVTAVGQSTSFGGDSADGPVDGSGNTRPEMLTPPRLPQDMCVAPSPEAAAMTRYVDLPVDYSSGTLNLSVPVIQWQCGSMPMSLAVSYSSRTIKFNDRASCVGLGWSINAGGTVSRTVNGRPDEINGAYPEPDYGNTSIFEREAILFEYLATASDDKTFDTALDRYSFSVAGYSGTFFILPDGSISQFPASAVKIERTGVLADRVRDFKITTPDGAEHFFTDREISEYTFKAANVTTEPQNCDYRYVSAWRLTSSVSPEKIDTIRYEYSPVPDWTRNNSRNDESYTYQQVLMRSPLTEPSELYMVSGGSSRSGGAGINTTKIKGQRIISAIRSRTATARFHTSCFNTIRDNSQRFVIDSISLWNAAGEKVSSAKFSYINAVLNEPILRDIWVLRDGIIIDSRHFDYKNEGVNTNFYADVYGNLRHSGKDIKKSVYLSNGARNPDMRPDSATMMSWLLDAVTDIRGAITEVFYEPSALWTDTVTVTTSISAGGIDNEEEKYFGPHRKPSTQLEPDPWVNIVQETVSPGGLHFDFSRDVCYYEAPSVRVKMIRTFDPNETIWRKREFVYEGATATLPIENMNRDWFRTLTGKYDFSGDDPKSSTVKETLTATLTSASRIPGVPLENVNVFHNSVTEIVTASSMADTLVTTRRYDVAPALHSAKYTGTGVSSEKMWAGSNQFILVARYISGNPLIYNIPSQIVWMFHMGQTPAVFCERIGAQPLLLSESQWRGNGNSRRELSRTEYSWFAADSAELVTSTHVEALTYTEITDNYKESGSSYESSRDFHYFAVPVTYRTWLCEKTVQTQFFDNGGSREVTTLHGWNGVSSPWEKSDKAPDINRLLSTAYSDAWIPSLPRRTVTICGTTRVEQLNQYVANATLGSEIRRLRSLGRLTAPLGQVWISGNDTVVSKTVWSLFQSTQLMAPRLQSVGHFNRPVASTLEYTAYSPYGHPVAIVRDNGPKRVIGWGYDGDCMVSDSVSGAPTRRVFTHRPLVGCTSITEPWGLHTTYSYDGGRLSRVDNHSGQPVSAWEYCYRGFSDSNENFITQTTYGAAGASLPVSSTTIYNVLGLPSITRAHKAGGQGEDIVAMTETDGLGRTVAEWMPVPVKSGTFIQPWKFQSLAYSYHGSERPFRSTVYRDSGLRSAIEVTEAGDDMEGHPAVSHTLGNTTAGTYCCRYYRLLASGTVALMRGSMPAGSLSVAESIDADGRRLLTFTDFRGLKVLERRLSGNSSNADTYYIYDNLGRLRMVLPPEFSRLSKTTVNALTDADFQRFCYLYTYDDRMRLSSKKLPGAERIDYGYDRTGALTLWSDGEQRARGVVGFSLRDAAGRDKVSGEAASVPLTSAENIMATATYMPASSRADASGHTYNLALSDMKIHKAVYYDNYRFMRDVAAFASLDSLSPWFYANSRKSMALGSLTAVFGEGGAAVIVPGFRASVTEFDIEGRPTQIHTTGLNNSVSTRINEYAFDGLPTYSYDYRRTGSTIDGVLHYYGYDSQRRLTADTVKVRHIAPGVYTDSVAAIVSRTYDRLGRPSLVRPHTEATYGYNYNLRGQITEITSRYLIQKLYYETGGRTPQYGGNVSAMEWRNYGMGSDVGMWRYDYSYDRLDRLTAADFSATATDGSAMAPDYSCGYTYDLNSNLTSLWRRGPTILSPAVYDEVDRLTIAHDGNRVTTVTEAAGEVVLENSMDYKATAGSEAAARTYDLNGNLISDPARGIKSITNNPLGLPQKIERAEGNPVNMIYDADGNRLAYWRGGTGTSIIVTPRPNPGLQPLGLGIGSLYPELPTLSGEKALTRILDGPLAYTDDKLTRIDTDGGYIADGRFHAVYPDFQGNIRAVACGGEIKQVNHYYPYGLPFAEGIKPDAQPYKYGAKELITDANLDLYDFHARFYDPAVPSWSNPDAHQESYLQLSPYAFSNSNPINVIDPTGMDGVRIVDEESKTITIKANYYVVTASTNFAEGQGNGFLKGYSLKDIDTFNNYNQYLNDLNLTVTEGQYSGYSIKFDLTFTDGGTATESKESASQDTYEEYSIGNTIQRGNAKTHPDYNFAEKYDENGTSRQTGGVTLNRTDIVMNTDLDSRRNRLHEIFHTFGFSHPKGSGASQGIMKYPPSKPSKKDANKLSIIPFLPTINKKN